MLNTRLTRRICASAQTEQRGLHAAVNLVFTAFQRADLADPMPWFVSSAFQQEDDRVECHAKADCGDVTSGHGKVRVSDRSKAQKKLKRARYVCEEMQHC